LRGILLIKKLLNKTFKQVGEKSTQSNLNNKSLSKAYFYEYIGKGNKCILNVPQT
jgi:hypothetical protein